MTLGALEKVLVFGAGAGTALIYASALNDNTPQTANHELTI